MSFIDSVVGLPVELYFKTPFSETVGGFYSAMERHSGPYRLKTAKKGHPCDYCAKKETLFRCPRCKSAFYCSREHLKSDWKLHKRKCTGYTATGNQPTITDRICLRDNGGFMCYEDNLLKGSIPYIFGRRLIERKNIELAHFVVESLYLTGRCVIDNFNGSNLKTHQILREVKALHEYGALKDGELASSSSSTSNNSHKIRGDKIAWVDSRMPECEAIVQHISSVDALMYLCNELIPEYDIQTRTKGMVACYPGNHTAYKRHVDNYKKDGRCITTTYYLNKDWRSEVDGGIFRMYPEGSGKVDIDPIFDRLLIFWSDKRNPHEVLPSNSTRYAITLWYFDKAERETFLKKERLTRLNKLLKQQSESQKREATPMVFKIPKGVNHR